MNRSEPNTSKKNKLSMKDIMTDRKYRARAILVFYAILFTIVIIWSRSLPETVDKPKNNSKEETPNAKVEEEIFEGFELIAEKNFEFTYTFELNKNKIISSGKKHENKEQFISTVNENDSVDYLVDGSFVKAKDKSKDKYVEINKPFIILDYFDISLINKILLASVKISETELTISNSELCLLINCSFENEEAINKIELDLKNNNIVNIKIDCLSLMSSVELNPEESELIEKASIILEYKNFNLVENFNINWE